MQLNYWVFLAVHELQILFHSTFCTGACRASKAALNIINKALCNDLSASHQVQSVLLHPGYVS